MMKLLPFIVAESLNEFLSKGAIYKLRWQDEVGKWYWKCQRYADFPLYHAVNEFWCHNCQPSVGRLSIMVKIFSPDVVCERPL